MNINKIKELANIAGNIGLMLLGISSFIFVAWFILGFGRFYS